MSGTNLIYRWEHVYNGEVIGEIRRYPRESTKGGKKKKNDYPYYMPNGKGGYSSGIPESMMPRPLFGLDSIKNINKPVVICAGQKCQQAWVGLGYQAVTSIGGESAAHLANWSELAGCRKLLLAHDNDAAGRTWAALVAKILKKQNPDAELINCVIPGLPEKGDVCDWAKSQPELTDWNELDPLHDIKGIKDVRKRLSEIAEPQAVPVEWLKEYDWNEPENIETGLLRVRRLDAKLIPNGIREWAVDNSRRSGAPIEMYAVSALIVIAATIGAGCQVQPKRRDPFKITPVLWGFVCGPPGSAKSTAMGKALSPFHQLDERAVADHEVTALVYEREKLKHEEAVSRVKQGLKEKQKRGDATSPEDSLDNLKLPPKAPQPKRHATNDATIEAVAKLLSGSPRGLLVFQDELYKLLKSWESEGKGADRPFYLQGWNGDQPYVIDRATKDPIRIEKLCLTLFGGIQPDLLKKYIVESGENLNDGLMQRFQAAIYLDKQDLNERVELDEEADANAERKYKDLILALASDSYVSYGAEQDKDGTPYFRFDDAGQSIYFSWVDSLKETMRSEEDPYLEQHWAKYGRLMPTLALIFHVIAVVNGDTPPGRITEASARLGAIWCGFFEQHARRIYGINKSREQQSASVLGQKINWGELGNKFTIRDVVRHQWRGLRDKETVNQACKELSEAGWIQKAPRTGRSGGRPTEEYVVNPNLELVLS